MKRARHVGARRTARRWSLGSKILSATVGVLLVGTASYAAANWIVGLATGSKAEGQSSSVQNVTISAAASPAATNLLYPGGTGDVVATIANPNPFPVTITAVSLPTSTTYAAGYSNNTLATAMSGCDATTSMVGWSFAATSSGTSHLLTNPLTVPGNNAPFTVTFTNDATMSTSAPAACEQAYFSMPSLTGVTATGGQATTTTSPATDAWTS